MSHIDYAMVVLTQASQDEIDARMREVEILKTKLSYILQQKVCAKCGTALSNTDSPIQVIGGASVAYPIRGIESVGSFGFIMQQPRPTEDDACEGHQTVTLYFKLLACHNCYEPYLARFKSEQKSLRRRIRLCELYLKALNGLLWIAPIAFVVLGGVGAMFCPKWYLSILFGCVCAIVARWSVKCGINRTEGMIPQLKREVRDIPDTEALLIDSWFASEVKKLGFTMVRGAKNAPKSFLLPTNKDLTTITIDREIGFISKSMLESLFN